MTQDDNAMLRGYLELIRDEAANPTHNELEAGFRHSPLTPREITQRMSEALDHIAVLASDALRIADNAQG